VASDHRGEREIDEMAGKRVLRDPRRVVFVAALIGSLVVVGSVGAWPSPRAPRGPAYLTGVTLNACNTIEYGQYVNGVRKKIADNRGSQCSSLSLPDIKRSYPRGGHTVLYLYDLTCNAVYYSDGTGDADHAVITAGVSSDELDIADAGGGCSDKFNTVSPAPGLGNLSLFVAPAGALA
jgi:hypothetical protein